MSEPTPHAWWRHPGQCHDAKGIPIYPGDLLRSPHFVGARKKRYYLYHVAVYVNGYMEMVPTCHLQPDKIEGGGRCMLSDDLASYTEVIQGHGPGRIVAFEDRPRNRIAKATAGPEQADAHAGRGEG